MMPIGPLMKEHRLIERMLNIVDQRLELMKKENKADIPFIDVTVDFIKNYADKRHHGKEEDILFGKLDKKELSAEHRTIMDELIKEHVVGRNTVKRVVDAKERYAGGDKDALKDIVENVQILIEFYPKHIEKEDKHFFIPCMDYFTEKEKDDMLKEGEEFDIKLNQKDHESVVEQFETNPNKENRPQEKQDFSKMPNCQSSVTAEHDRLKDDDEPCDDGVH
ncbi:MAG: hemerythrin domain-containing protein [Candidatus Omnitrophota bacterium]